MNRGCLPPPHRWGSTGREILDPLIEGSRGNSHVIGSENETGKKGYQKGGKAEGCGVRCWKKAVMMIGRAPKNARYATG